MYVSISFEDHLYVLIEKFELNFSDEPTMDDQVGVRQVEFSTYAT